MVGMHKLQQRYRYSFILLKQLVKTDFKLRYQGSALGYVWSLLKPLLLFVTLYFVFARFLNFGDTIEHYPQYLLLGILLWNYFTEVTTGAVGAIVGKGDLMRKINFPKYVIILAGSFSAFINLLLNFVVLSVFMAFGGISIGWSGLLIIPLIAELFIFSIALAFFLSALFVRFRDISYIWEVVMQAAFYATPILYALQIVPHNIAKYMILNPMAQIIQDSRYVLITNQTQTISYVYGGNSIIWAIPIGVTLITVVLAATYFRSRSKYFAEEV
ncbi:MAG: type transporter [Candidatus Saccharibacteria bacterium]|nr:type transporter [Candidatus Saccharibacteria bacterium]